MDVEDDSWGAAASITRQVLLSTFSLLLCCLLGLITSIHLHDLDLANQISPFEAKAMLTLGVSYLV